MKEFPGHTDALRSDVRVVLFSGEEEFLFGGTEVFVALAKRRGKGTWTKLDC